MSEEKTVQNTETTAIYSGIDLLSHLSLAIGPSGCEREVRELIESQLPDSGIEKKVDKIGNLIVKIAGKRSDKPLMLSAHMDEVGFMINEIDDEGYIRFVTVGGIDARVLCGRRVVLTSLDGERRIEGLISSKAIHLQSWEERTKATPIDKMYIDIGAKNREEAEKHIKVGDFGTFKSEFYRFGSEKKPYIKGKAIDDRFGCAIMLETIREFAVNPPQQDTYFAFTVREEVGLSGAACAAFEINPAKAIVLEATAVADIVDVPDMKKVAQTGEGGAISLLDYSTIYDHDFVKFALDTAKRHEVKAQIKQYVSGRNDAGHIHKIRDGVKTLAISAPSRYIHTASCVIAESDYFSVLELVGHIIRDIDIDF